METALVEFKPKLEEVYSMQENRYEDREELIKDFCETVELYLKTMSDLGEIGYYESEDSSFATVNLRMLELITEELRILKCEFDKLKEWNTDETKLLPCKWEIEAPLRKLLLDDVFINLLKGDDFFPKQQDAYNMAREAREQLLRTLLIFNRKEYAHPLRNSGIIFEKLMERYKGEQNLDFWMEHLTGDKNEEKRKLDDEFKRTPVGKIWFQESGDIYRTILVMHREKCVQRDLLSLLDYKAKYDRLMAQEKCIAQAKETNPQNKVGRKKGKLFLKEEVRKRECARLKGFLMKNSSYKKEWDATFNNPVTDVVLCFARHWLERGDLLNNYSVAALVTFIVEDCGVRNGVTEKALAGKLRGWRESRKIDSVVEKSVGAEFQND